MYIIKKAGIRVFWFSAAIFFILTVIVFFNLHLKYNITRDCEVPYEETFSCLSVCTCVKVKWQYFFSLNLIWRYFLLSSRSLPCPVLQIITNQVEIESITIVYTMNTYTIPLSHYTESPLSLGSKTSRRKSIISNYI